jgi:small subunit ribosomal protein S16
MVKIRLTRTGKKHQPHYRIVAVDSRAKRDGRYIEKIGYYNPRTKPPTLDYDKEILLKWIDNGAQMTDTVHDIFVNEGIVDQTGKRKARISAMISASKAENAPEEGETTKEGKEKESPKKEEKAKSEEKKEPKEESNDQKEDTEDKVAKDKAAEDEEKDEKADDEGKEEPKNKDNESDE